MTGILYVCATPIGNLSDITFRAIDALQSVDRIMAEDTRVTQKLLDRYEITTPMMSYHKFNEKSRTQEVIQYLQDGKNIALVSDAGTPTISDPGAVIVQACLQSCIQVVPIPGPSSVMAALSASGVLSGPFIFYGFPDKAPSKKEEELLKLKNTTLTYILFESPGRMIETLTSLQNIYGEAIPTVTIARELTKLHEEIITASLPKVIEHYLAKKVLGEIVMIVHGQEDTLEIPYQKIEQAIITLSHGGLSTAQIVKKLNGLWGLSKNQLYDLVLQALSLNH